MSVFHLDNSHLEAYDLWALFLLKPNCGVPNCEGLGGGWSSGLRTQAPLFPNICKGFQGWLCWR